MTTKEQTSGRFALLSGEKVLACTGLHWMNRIGPSMMMTVMLTLLTIRCLYIRTSFINHLAGHQAVPETYQATAAWTGTAIIVLLLGKALYRLADAVLTRYYITDRRIIITSGVVTIKMSEMSLMRCETVNIKQNLIERILSTGDLLVVSAGTSLYMNDVPDISGFRMIIMEAISKNRNYPEPISD